MTLAAARETLRAALATVPGLTAHAYMPSAPIPPCVAVLPTRMDFDATFSGGTRQRFDVWLYASGTDLVRGQAEIDVFIPLVEAALSDVPGVRVIGWNGYAQLVGVLNKEPRLLGMSLSVELDE